MTGFTDYRESLNFKIESANEDVLRLTQHLRDELNSIDEAVRQGNRVHSGVTGKPLVGSSANDLVDALTARQRAFDSIVEADRIAQMFNAEQELEWEHRFAEGDLVAHRDSPDQKLVVNEVTIRKTPDGKLLPTYTLEGETYGMSDVVEDVLDTADIVSF